MKTFLFALVTVVASTTFAVAQNATTYGGECAREVTPVSTFNCSDGVEVPVTVDGVSPQTYTPGQSCDRPSLLPPFPGQKTDGQCIPYSRALILRDDDVAQISVFCRRTIIRPADSDLYDEIDVIAHSVRNGRTCWFQASLPGEPAPDRGVNGRDVPSPTDVAALSVDPAPVSFWNEPRKTAALNCVSCHDSGPYMYSPFIAQVHAVPADPFGLYSNDVGEVFKAWPRPHGITTDGNTCTGCHRIGNMNSCHVTMFLAIGEEPIAELDSWGRRFPQSHWMPPGDLRSEAQWNQAYVESVAQLAVCCHEPSLPQCRRVDYDAAYSSLVGRPDSESPAPH
jgi:hypothetical protein